MHPQARPGPAPHLSSSAVAASLLMLAAAAGAEGGGPAVLWQLVGDQGNPAEPLFTFGATTVPYSLSKHEATNADYVQLLNAKAALGDPFQLFTFQMETDGRGGIRRTGSGTAADPFVYAAKPNMADKPVNFVSWFDAARFANWLHNGGGDGSTEDGAYALNGMNPSAVERAPGALVFLPSEDEWFKGAYYDPTAGPAGFYWTFPTQQESLPVPALATATGGVANPGPQVANYGSFADWGGLDGNTTAVGGAGPQSATFYGCDDMGGNVFEWTDTKFVFMGTNRIIRGGSWLDAGESMGKNMRVAGNPTLQSSRWGFRVARLEGNPAQSLTVQSGAPSIGTTLVLGMDNPLGTQSAGALPFLAVSTAGDPAAPFGSLIPGLSMLGPGVAGELLISVARPNPVSVAVGAAWGGPGMPAPVLLAIPPDGTLPGTTVHAQGLMVDLAPGAAVPLGLTNGLALLLQP